MFPPLIFVAMGLGIAVLIVGVVIANIAVLKMSERLDAKYEKLRPKRWWEVIGSGSTMVIREYRQHVWSDAVPNTLLRHGYRLIAGGLATICCASLLGNYLRESL